MFFGLAVSFDTAVYLFSAEESAPLYIVSHAGKEIW